MASVDKDRRTNGGIDFESASAIMDDNILSPDEVFQALGINGERANFFKYPQAFAKIRFPKAILHERKEDFVLFPDPGWSIVAIQRAVDPTLFYFRREDDIWYASENFAQANEGPTWRLLRKRPVRGTLNEVWAKQLELLPSGEEVPTARVIFSGIVLRYVVIRERLLLDNYTVSQSASSSRILLGEFDARNGLRVSTWADDRKDPRIGLISVKTPIW